MKNSYRERILQEKKKLDPEQVFCSPSYEKLLQSIANEIAGEKFEQLLLYKNAEYWGTNADMPDLRTVPFEKNTSTVFCVETGIHLHPSRKRMKKRTWKSLLPIWNEKASYCSRFWCKVQGISAIF